MCKFWAYVAFNKATSAQTDIKHEKERLFHIRDEVTYFSHIYLTAHIHEQEKTVTRAPLFVLNCLGEYENICIINTLILDVGSVYLAVYLWSLCLCDVGSQVSLHTSQIWTLSLNLTLGYTFSANCMYAYSINCPVIVMHHTCRIRFSCLGLLCFGKKSFHDYCLSRGKWLLHANSFCFYFYPSCSQFSFQIYSKLHPWVFFPCLWLSRFCCGNRWKIIQLTLILTIQLTLNCLSKHANNQE